jgi:hypothetical protein
LAIKNLFGSIIADLSLSTGSMGPVNLRNECYADSLIPSTKTLFCKLTRSTQTIKCIEQLSSDMSHKFQNPESRNILLVLKRLSSWDDPELRMALAYMKVIGSRYKFKLLVIGEPASRVPKHVKSRITSLGIDVILLTQFNINAAFELIEALPDFRNTFCLSDISTKVSPACLLFLSGIFGRAIVNMSTIMSTGAPHLQVISSLSVFSNDANSEYSEKLFLFPNGGAFFFGNPSSAPPTRRPNSRIPALIAYTSLHKFNQDYADLLLLLSSRLRIPLHLYPFAPHFGQPDSELLDKLSLDPNIQLFNSSMFRTCLREYNYLLGISSPAYPNVTSLVDLMAFAIPTVSWSSSFKRKNMGCLFNQILGLNQFNLPANKSLHEKADSIVGLLDRTETKKNMFERLAASAIIV